MELQITDQELFDNAALGIMHQGYEPCIDVGVGDRGCMVMSHDGTKRCAIGWSVTDAMPGRATTPQWYLLTGTRSIARRLRVIHDVFLNDYGKDRWLENMAKLALEYGLDDSCLWHTPVTAG